MLIPTLYAMGFSATALTTQPAPSILALMFAYALATRGGQPMAYTLAIFMGALSATLLGRPAGWQPVTSPWALLIAGSAYVLQLFVSPSAALAQMFVVQLVEHTLLEPHAFFSKLLCHCAVLLLCLVVDPSPMGIIAEGGSMLHIYCTVVVVSGCWLWSYGWIAWRMLKNAIQ